MQITVSMVVPPLGGHVASPAWPALAAWPEGAFDGTLAPTEQLDWVAPIRPSRQLSEFIPALGPLKVTVPVDLPWVPVTVAVEVRVWPVRTGFGEHLTVVVPGGPDPAAIQGGGTEARPARRSAAAGFSR